MKQTSYSAPAKVILTGEHAVVYGKPALVAGLDLRLQVTARAGEEKNPRFREIAASVLKYLEGKNLAKNREPLTMTVESAIPSGRGLGSSAALSVASSAALGELYAGAPLGAEDINNCAYRVEKLFHANPSGVDTSASCFGGLIYFRKEFEFLKTISSLNVKIPQSIARNLLLVDTGRPEEATSEMVQAVGKLYNTGKKTAESAFSAIEKITKRMVVAIMKEDGGFFAQCLADNEAELEKVGAVSPSSARLLRSLAPWGTGKITGAGGRKKGSGFALFYSQERDGLEEYLKAKGIGFVTFAPALKGYEKIL